MFCLNTNKTFTLKQANYPILAYSALSVPETAKTCIDALLPATPVTAASDARTIGKDASEERTTKILRAPSKLIKDKPVVLAPTSPNNFVTEAQSASINSRSLGNPSDSN